MCTAAQQGWDTLKNGELLAAAEADGFDVLLTTDKNMRYQQNLAGRKIAVVVLGSSNGRDFGHMSGASSKPSRQRCPAATQRSSFRRNVGSLFLLFGGKDSSTN